MESREVRDRVQLYGAEFDIAFRNGNFPQALGALDRALALRQGSVDLLLKRSQCYCALGRPAEAVSDATAVLAADNLDFRAFNSRAKALYLSGEFEAALLDYYRAVEIRPDIAQHARSVKQCETAIRQATAYSNEDIDAALRALENGTIVENSIADGRIMEPRPLTLRAEDVQSDRELLHLAPWSMPRPPLQPVQESFTSMTEPPQSPPVPQQSHSAKRDRLAEDRLTFASASGAGTRPRRMPTDFSIDLSEHKDYLAKLRHFDSVRGLAQQGIDYITQRERYWAHVRSVSIEGDAQGPYGQPRSYSARQPRTVRVVPREAQTRGCSERGSEITVRHTAASQLRAQSARYGLSCAQRGGPTQRSHAPPAGIVSVYSQRLLNPYASQGTDKQPSETTCKDADAPNASRARSWNVRFGRTEDNMTLKEKSHLLLTREVDSSIAARSAERLAMLQRRRKAKGGVRGGLASSQVPPSLPYAAPGQQLRSKSVERQVHRRAPGLPSPSCQYAPGQARGNATRSASTDRRASRPSGAYDAAPQPRTATTVNTNTRGAKAASAARARSSAPTVQRPSRPSEGRSGSARGPVRRDAPSAPPPQGRRDSVEAFARITPAARRGESVPQEDANVSFAKFHSGVTAQPPTQEDRERNLRPITARKEPDSKGGQSGLNSSPADEASQRIVCGSRLDMSGLTISPISDVREIVVQHPSQQRALRATADGDTAFLEGIQHSLVDIWALLQQKELAAALAAGHRAEQQLLHKVKSFSQTTLTGYDTVGFTVLLSEVYVALAHAYAACGKGESAVDDELANSEVEPMMLKMLTCAQNYVQQFSQVRTTAMPPEARRSEQAMVLRESMLLYLEYSYNDRALEAAAALLDLVPSALVLRAEAQCVCGKALDAQGRAAPAERYLRDALATILHASKNAEQTISEAPVQELAHVMLYRPPTPLRVYLEAEVVLCSHLRAQGRAAEAAKLLEGLTGLLHSRGLYDLERLAREQLAL